MWPKLLRSSAVEALRLRAKGTKVQRASQVEGILARRQRRHGDDSVDRRIKLVKRASERQVLVESRDGENWVYRSVVKK